MSTGFKKVYPSVNRIMFDGGMNSKFARALLQDSESPECRNVRFEDGGVETRGGTTKLTSSTLGSFVGDGIYTRHTDDGQETMVVFGGARMYYWAGTTFATVPSATSVFTAGVRVGAAEQESYLFVNNGSTVAYKYNGDFTRHGIYPPTDTPTVTSNATGLLTGAYQWKVTNVNTGLVESDVSTATASLTLASATARIVLQTFAASYGVAARKIYRTVVSGSVYKLVGTVSNNTATTFDDNVADASLGANAPSDQSVPPAYNRIVYLAGRLFCNDVNNPNYLWWSEIDNPYVFKATNFIKVGDNTSDLIRGIEVFDNNILVNCVKSQHMIYMPDTDSANWLSVRLQSPYGSKSPYGCFEFDAQVMVPVLENGIFAGFAPVSGRAIQPSTTFLTVNSIQSLLASNPIEPDMLQIQNTYVGNISSIVFKNRAYISCTSGTAQTTNNRVWVFDFAPDKEGTRGRYAWSPDTGVEAAQFTIYANKLYFVTSTEPCYVNEYETSSYNDNGVAINSYFWTKEFTGDVARSIQSHKDFRAIKLLVANAGNYNMLLNYRLNSEIDDGNSQQINLNPGGSLWGTMIWGQDNWGGGMDESDKKISLGGARGERIQFRFSNNNTADQKFEVKGLRFFFNERGYR